MSAVVSGQGAMPGPIAPAALLRVYATVLLLSLGLLLAWEWAALDLPLSAWAGGALGFPLRRGDSWASRLHDLGRLAAGVGLLLLWLHAWWPARGAGAHHHTADNAVRFRRRWVAASTLLCLLAVPALKRISETSCPWDLMPFGGQVPYVPHWRWGQTDGGPGHCFPSGHAVGAWAFAVPAVSAWAAAARSRGSTLGRGAARAAHRIGLAAVVLAGLVFGAVQVIRGAHHASHVAWSAWLCVAWALGSDLLFQWWVQRRDGQARGDH